MKGLTVNVEVASGPGVTAVGLRETTTPDEGVTFVERSTVSPNPPRPVIVTVGVPDEWLSRNIGLGLASILKSTT